MRRLIDRYPEFWKQSPETAELIEALGTEVLTFRAAVDDFKRQLFVDTATWGLSLWEKAWGLSVDEMQQPEIRRARIKARIRGFGTATPEMIRSIVRAFTPDDVTLLEEPARYWFTVKISGSHGLTAHLEDLTAILDEIKPAHIGYGYQCELQAKTAVLHCGGTVAIATRHALPQR